MFRGLFTIIQWETRCDAVAQACECKRDKLWVRFPLGGIKYSFYFRRGNEVHRGIVFWLYNSAEERTECLNTRFSDLLGLPFYLRDIAWSYKKETKKKQKAL